MSEENVIEEKKVRQDVYSKDDFVTRVQSTIEELVNVKLSKTKVWDITKAVIATVVDMSVEKPVSLSGVVRAEVITSHRSGNMKARIRPSSKIDQLINAGESVADFYRKPEKEDSAEVATPAPKNEPKAKGKGKPKEVEAPAAEDDGDLL